MRQAILIACGLLGTACQTPTSVEQRLFVGLAVGAASFQRGTALDVRIVVRNRSERAITVTANTCPYVFRVEDARGAVVGPEQQICDAMLRQRTLARNDSLVFLHQWHGHGLGGDHIKPAPLLSAGQYYLRAQVPSEIGVARSDRVAVLLLP